LNIEITLVKCGLWWPNIYWMDIQSGVYRPQTLKGTTYLVLVSMQCVGAMFLVGRWDCVCSQESRGSTRELRAHRELV